MLSCLAAIGIGRELDPGTGKNGKAQRARQYQAFNPRRNIGTKSAILRTTYAATSVQKQKNRALAKKSRPLYLSKNDQLIEACINNDFDHAKRLLDRGADANWSWGKSRSLKNDLNDKIDDYFNLTAFIGEKRDVNGVKLDANVEEQFNWHRHSPNVEIYFKYRINLFKKLVNTAYIYRLGRFDHRTPLEIISLIEDFADGELPDRGPWLRKDLNLISSSTEEANATSKISDEENYLRVLLFRDGDGYLITPILAAYIHRNIKLFNLLVAHGASPWIYGISNCRGFYRIANDLSKLAIQSPELMDALLTAQRHWPTRTTLVGNHNYDTTAKSEDCVSATTLLRAACEEADFDLLPTLFKWLLNEGACPPSPSGYGAFGTVLHNRISKLPKGSATKEHAKYAYEEAKKICIEKGFFI